MGASFLPLVTSTNKNINYLKNNNLYDAFDKTNFNKNYQNNKTNKIFSIQQSFILG